MRDFSEAAMQVAQQMTETINTLHRCQEVMAQQNAEIIRLRADRDEAVRALEKHLPAMNIAATLLGQRGYLGASAALDAAVQEAARIVAMRAKESQG